MRSNTTEPEVVRVSQKGQATIPKPLREKFGIETPGEVFVYEADDRIVIEPVPSLEELHGIHAGEDEPGAVTAKVRELRAAEKEREDERAEAFRPSTEE
ncbi:AbrB/MazE/SpoVT family DNA-binding domain-containing protein (plasmid) [Halorientalis pallida]|uniref:AbrB/MazE/SpoVT family DNA-binding domain-containing protein n=1 Tax=Halorientalis pallida TaxID=2479928 RepID=UPI003C6FE3EC